MTLFLLALLAVAAPPSRVHVLDGEHREALSRALSEEPDLIVGTASTAQVLVSLVRVPEGGALLLTVSEPNGSTALARRIDLRRGIDPALRMAVLLVRGSFEAPPPPPAVRPTNREENAVGAPVLGANEPSEDGLSLWITPAIGTVELAELDPAGVIYLHLRSGPATFGVAGMFGAGGRATPQIEGDRRDLVVLVDGAFAFVDRESLAISAFVSAGADFVRMTTRASSPPFPAESMGTPSPTDRRSFIALFGIEGRVWIAGPLAIDVRAGLRWMPQRIRITLPDAFVAANPIAGGVTPLESSVLGGFLSLGTTFEVF